MWRSIIAIKLEHYWKFTPEIEGIYFRFRHIEPPKSPIGWVGQAEGIANTDFNQVFQIQRLNGLVNYEILEYKKPPIFESRKLAFRQEPRVANNWIIEVEVSDYMPVVDLNADQPVVNPTITTIKNVLSVPIAATATAPTKLLPISTNNIRKHATFYNPSTTRNLYIDTDSTINTASAIAKVAPGKVYVSDIPGWQGEYWGMLDGTGTSATNIAVEEYV